MLGKICYINHAQVCTHFAILNQWLVPQPPTPPPVFCHTGLDGQQAAAQKLQTWLRELVKGSHVLHLRQQIEGEISYGRLRHMPPNLISNLHKLARDSQALRLLTSTGKFIDSMAFS